MWRTLPGTILPHIIPIKGKSYRLRDATEKQAEQNGHAARRPELPGLARLALGEPGQESPVSYVRQHAGERRRVLSDHRES
ncbi:MAG: hypothetical protein M5U28_03370 [Sandaracinaceae bacterium]|nr:hypothetical protein [Sandaracinaceae bacterium]